MSVFRSPGSSVNVLPILLVTVSLCPKMAIHALDLLEECKKTDDSHVTRGNFTCCSHSPRGIPLQPALDFQAGWKKCAVEPKSLNEDPVISAWRVYRCIIFQGIYGKPLLPSTFTDFMTSKYPELVKAQIFSKMSEFEESNMKFELDVECLKRTPYPKVHLLRNLFYDIEQQVCEGSINVTTYQQQDDNNNVTHSRGGGRPFRGERRNQNIKRSATSSDFAENLCETCDRRKAMYHRNGDCCSHVPIPFPFVFLPYRYGNHEKVNQCAEDLVDDVGLPTDTEFSTHLQYLCYTSCEHYLAGALEENDFWTGVGHGQTTDIRNLVLKLMPQYFSSKYKQEIIRYVLGNFQLAWSETQTFESKIHLSQRDIRNCDKGKLRNLLTSCKTHRLIETIMTLFLNNLCLDLYPLRELNGTTPHSLLFGFTNTTTPPSTAVSNDEVSINFDWGRPGGSNHGGGGGGSTHHHHHHHNNNYDYDNDDNGSHNNEEDGSSFSDFANTDARRHGSSSGNSGSRRWWSTTTPSSRHQYVRVF